MTREEVAAFIAEFEACRLSKQQWTHQAHLTSGLWYLKTITRLYLMAIGRPIRAQQGLTFEASLQGLLDLELRSSAWPLTWYSPERLFSVAARRGWVEPYLQSMPGEQL